PELVGRDVGRERKVADQHEHLSARGHAAAPALSMTVRIGAVRCRWTPLGLKETPSASSASIARQSIWYCAGMTLSLLISQLRSTSRDRPERLARSSRVRPAKARPARNRFPVNL